MMTFLLLRSTKKTPLPPTVTMKHKKNTKPKPCKQRRICALILKPSSIFFFGGKFQASNVKERSMDCTEASLQLTGHDTHI